MTKLIHALRSFAKEPKKESTTNNKSDVCCCHSCEFDCYLQGGNSVFSVEVHRPSCEFPCRWKNFTLMDPCTIQIL